jgi:hypothetical protein
VFVAQLFAALPSDGPVGPGSATQAVFANDPTLFVATGMVIAVKFVPEAIAAVNVREQVTVTGPAIGYGGAPETVHVQKLPGLVGADRIVTPNGTGSVTCTIVPIGSATGPLLRGVST